MLPLILLSPRMLTSAVRAGCEQIGSEELTWFCAEGREVGCLRCASFPLGCSQIDVGCFWTQWFCIRDGTITTSSFFGGVGWGIKLIIIYEILFDPGSWFPLLLFCVFVCLFPSPFVSVYPNPFPFPSFAAIYKWQSIPFHGNFSMECAHTQCFHIPGKKIQEQN